LLKQVDVSIFLLESDGIAVTREMPPLKRVPTPDRL